MNREELYFMTDGSKPQKIDKEGNAIEKIEVDKT